jgi:hypothetical protein
LIIALDDDDVPSEFSDSMDEVTIQRFIQKKERQAEEERQAREAAVYSVLYPTDGYVEPDRLEELRQ